MSTCVHLLLIGTIFATLATCCTAVEIAVNRTGKTQRVITITPGNKTLCPSVGECYTIEELMYLDDLESETVQWLEINFLQGRHLVSERTSRKTLRIDGKYYLELSGVKTTHFEDEDRVPIIVHPGVWFLFEQNHYVNISSLTFKSTPSGEPHSQIFVTLCDQMAIIENVTTIGTKTRVDSCRSAYIINTNLLHYNWNEDTYDLHISNNKETVLNNCTCGLLVIDETNVVKFQGYVCVRNNIGDSEAISVKQSTIHFDFNSETVISNNNYTTGTEDSSIASFTTNSKLIFYENSTLRIKNNTASGCGGIKLVESRLQIRNNSTLIFSGNTGRGNGGALALYRGSDIRFESLKSINVFVIIKFIDNRAGEKGGAIYVDDSGYLKNGLPVVPILVCKLFIQTTPTIYFINNTAKEAGDEIYGGRIDWPFHSSKIVSSPPCDTEYESVFSHLASNLSTVSSNPVRVCMCINAAPDCNITNHNLTMYPGQTLELEAVAVGQRFGTVPSTILAEYQISAAISHGKFERGQNIQSAGRYCTPLQYTVMSSNSEETIYLYTDNTLAIPNLYAGCDTCFVNPTKLNKIFSDTPELKTLFSNFTISVKLLDCPIGFILNEGKCTCHPTLINNGFKCNEIDYSILRPQTKWINATCEHTLNNTNYGILVHHHCPLDYCYNKDISINLESPQDQCDFNRSGILCGACQNKFSHVFGTSRCKKCSNLWTLLMVPSVIIAGIALVVFLMVLDLTVAIGTINGLIFYANIVRANQPIFFPTKEANTFLNIFIAWINLDLGVETCFYHGLDAYTETWLQFVFPFYIWLLVTLIIVSSHYSSTVSRWIGSNAVQVLATLFLLSYVKLLRLIITVFLSSTIIYPDGYIRRVWLYDGNVDFLKGKHIPLFIAALMTLVILTVPYTTTLTTIQWLQKHKHCKRALFWVHKFKPIFDAHTGPYKPNHRYWTGVLLLVRVALLLIFTINLTGDPSVNLLAITITTNCLSIYFFFIGGPYRSKMINLTEISFYFNACILSTATIYRLKIESNSTAVTTISTSIAFLIFILIVFYHAIQRITETRSGASLKHSMKERVMVFVRQSAPTLITITGQQGTTATQSHISHSSIELKEPLLADVGQIKQD